MDRDRTRRELANGLVVSTAAAAGGGQVGMGMFGSAARFAVPLPSDAGRDTDSESTASWKAPSWSEIVEQHSPAVYRLAYRLTSNRHDAEDLTQEVFVRVFRALESYTPGTFEGWLHRITTNLFLDQMRRKARIRFDSLPEQEGLADKVVGSSPSAERIHLDAAFDPDVEAALASLAPEFRVAVVLCDIEQLTYEEIAATLGVKIGTVRSRIHRGRSQLRRALAHRAPGSTNAPAGDPS